MTFNNDAANSLHVHYTPDPKHSIGTRVVYDREQDYVFTGVQVNRLVKRWNKSDSQANIYGKIAVGLVADEKSGPFKREDDAGLLLAASADWETRRYFVSASAEHWDNGRFEDTSAFHGRLGVAPYVANSGALHTWFMVEGHNRPEDDDVIGVTGLVRFFKGPSLLELGASDKGKPQINYIHRF